MSLRGEVVDLARAYFVDESRQVRGVGHIAVMQGQGTIGPVRILVEMIDAPGVDRRRPADESVHLIALFQQELSQVRAILAGDPGDQGACSGGHLSKSIDRTRSEL